VLKTRLGVKEVWRCNLLEDDEGEVGVEGGEVRVELRAFEVVTLRLVL